MINPLTWLSRRRYPYEPLITIEISKSRLLHNLEAFKKLAPDGRMAPVLKSNAYGHGLIEIASILEQARKGHLGSAIPFFVVDSYFEAVALRSEGIKTPLLVIGYTRPETVATSRLSGVSYTVTSLETLNKLAEQSRTVSIHLKIDTGMRRQGILPEEIQQAVDIILENPNIKIRGLCSHLCDSDNDDESFTESQINIWNRSAAKFKSDFPNIEFFHLSATDGYRFSSDISANVARLGLGLYGISSSISEIRPVLEMKTIITGIKRLHQGETVGYGNSFKAEGDMTIATIPVGYYEGLDRRLSNNGFVEVGPKRLACPIIGRVSMNIASIDITKAVGSAIDTPVVVISKSKNSPCSILSIAKRCQTIPYEIAVHIPGQLKRVVIE